MQTFETAGDFRLEAIPGDANHETQTGMSCFT